MRLNHALNQSSDSDDISGNMSASDQGWVQRPMFWRPDYVAASTWHEHIPFAFWAMHAHRPKVFVELGLQYGVSYFAFCQAVSKLGLDTACYGIDGFKEEIHSDEYDVNPLDQVKEHNDAHYSDFSTILHSTFEEALSYFPNGSIDLLHIDGKHTLDAVRTDFDSWFPKLSPNAVVLMHNTNVLERGFGAVKMFRDLCGRYQNFEFVHGHGLGVLGIGRNQSKTMLQLFSASKDELGGQMLREAFASLGQGCAAAFHVKENEKNAKRWVEQEELMDKQLQYLQQCLEKTHGEIEDLNYRVEEQNSAMQNEWQKLASEKGNLEGRLALLDTIRLQVMDELAQKKAELLHARATLDLRTREYEALKMANQEGESRNSELERLGNDASQRLEEALQEKKDLEGEIELVKEAKEQLVLAKSQIEANNRKLSETIVLFQTENSNLKIELAKNKEQIGRLELCAKDADLRAENLAQELSSEMNRTQKIEEKLRQEKAAVAQLQAKLSTAVKEMAELEKESAVRLDTLRMDTERQIDNLVSDKEKLTQDKSEAQSEIEELKRELERKSELAVQLESHKSQLADRFCELAELTKMLEEQDAVLKNKDKHALIMASSLDELKNRYEQAQEEITRLKIEIRENKSSLEERFREIAMLTQVVQQREADLNNKSDELNLEKERATHFRDLLEAQSSGSMASESPVVKESENEASQTKKRKIKGKRLSVDAQISLLDKSEILNNEWYLDQYEDVGKSGMSPAEHYVLYGAAEGRQPGPDFDTAWYVTNYPEVADMDMNPAVHYLKYGKKEGRATYSVKRS